MRMPFPAEEFFAVFAAYNDMFWPAPLFLTALAVVAIALALLPPGRASRGSALALSALWAWAGVAYHLVHFRTINPAAMAFGAAFILQAILFVIATARGSLSFGAVPATAASGSPRVPARVALAGVLLAYALVGYPIVGRFLGHTFPATPTFGAPCPTVIFTFGLLLLARPRVPRWLLIVPVLWALVASSAILAFGVYQDLGLTLAALTATPILLRDRPRDAQATPAAAVPGF